MQIQCFNNKTTFFQQIIAKSSEVHRRNRDLLDYCIFGTIDGLTTKNKNWEKNVNKANKHVTFFVLF